MVSRANREIPGIRLEGVRQRDGTPANPAGRIKGFFQAHQVRARQALGRNARSCLFGHNPILRQIRNGRQAKPAGRIKGGFWAHLRYRAGRPRDGTPGKTCGTDQRRLPRASSVQVRPRQAAGAQGRDSDFAGRLKTCSRLHAISLTQATGSPLLLAPAGAAPSPIGL